jgi:hypothetical protein
VSVPIEPRTGILLVRLGADIIAGDVTDGLAAARSLVGVALDLVPVEELRQYLTEGDRARADLAADMIEEAKLSE